MVGGGLGEASPTVSPAEATSGVGVRDGETVAVRVRVGAGVDVAASVGVRVGARVGVWLGGGVLVCAPSVDPARVGAITIAVG